MELNVFTDLQMYPPPTQAQENANIGGITSDDDESEGQNLEVRNGLNTSFAIIKQVFAKSKYDYS